MQLEIVFLCHSYISDIKNTTCRFVFQFVPWAFMDETALNGATVHMEARVESTVLVLLQRPVPVNQDGQDLRVISEVIFNRKH